MARLVGPTCLNMAHSLQIHPPKGAIRLPSCPGGLVSLRVPSRPALVASAAALLAGGLVATQGGGALANHTPADKPFAAASKTLRTGPTARIELLSATVKNSKPTDMVLQVSLECGLITDTILLGSNTPGAQDSTRATATIRAWIEI